MSTPQPPGNTAPPAETPAVTTPRAAEDESPSTWQPLLYAKIGLLLLVVAYAIAFVVENRQRIEIHFVFATETVRLIWAILLLLAVGVVGGILLSQLYRHRRRAKLAKKSR